MACLKMPITPAMTLLKTRVSRPVPCPTLFDAVKRTFLPSGLATARAVVPKVTRKVIEFGYARPLLFASGLGAAKCTLADFCVQACCEDHIDWARLAVFTFFGAVNTGFVQTLILARATPAIQSALKLQGFKGLTFAVAMDAFVNLPFHYFPCLYMWKNLLQSKDASFETLKKTYRENIWNDLKMVWGVYIPFNFVNFNYTPPAFRVPVILASSVFYAAAISYKRGKDATPSEE